MTETTYYPLLDLGASRDAARRFQQVYNREARRHNATHPDQKRQLLRDAVVETYVEILGFLAGYLNRRRRSQLQTASPFVSCHQTLANHLNCNRGTIMRRVARMVETGLLLDCRRHGSHFGVELRFRPELVLAKIDPQLGAARPALPAILFPVELQNATQRKGETEGNINQNHESGSCGQPAGAAATTTGEEMGGKHRKDEGGPEGLTVLASAASETEHRGAGAAVASRVVQRAFVAAQRALWPGQHLPQHQQAAALANVQAWFAERERLGSREAELVEEFGKRVELVQAWLRRDPSRFVPKDVAWYFDRSNRTGFVATASWYNRWRQDKERNARLYQAKAAIVQLVAEYLREPNIGQYQQLRSRLAKQWGSAAVEVLQYGIGLAATEPAEQVLRATEARALAWVHSYFQPKQTSLAPIQQALQEARAEYAYANDPSN